MNESFTDEDRELLFRALLQLYRRIAGLVTALKRCADYDAHPVLGDQRKNEDNVDQLLTRAAAEGWQTYFAFCTLANRYPKAEAKAAARELFKSDVRREAFELVETLNELRVEEAVLARCYSAAKPDFADPPPRPKEAKVTPYYVAHAICMAQEAAVGKPILRSFASELMAALPEDRRRPLLEWWGAAKGRIGLEGSLEGGKAGSGVGRPQERYSVMVELRDVDASPASRGERAWRPQAWLYRHHTGRFDPLDDDAGLDVRDAQPPLTVDTIASYLAALRSRLSSERVPRDRVMFEFFVSMKSLNCGHDRWSICLDLDLEIDVALGYEYPVVVRNLRDDASRVRERCETLAVSPPLSDGTALSQAVVTRGLGGKPTDAFKEFERLSHVLCLLVEGPFPEGEDFRKFACVGGAVVAGVPLIIWAREPAAAEALRARAAKILEGPVSALPEKFRELRYAADSEGAGPEMEFARHLTLFFEFGDHWLPGNDKLTGPE
jgi:hypothetical protein